MTTPWLILFIALWLTVLGETVLVLGLSKRLTALESTDVASAPASGASASVIPVGAPIPRAAADRLAIPSTDTAIRSSVILFLSPGCRPCLKLAELLRGHRLRRHGGDDSELVIVSNQAGTEQFGHIGRTVVDSDGTLARSLGVPGTPFGIAVDSQGVIRRVAIPSVAEDVERLADHRPPTPMEGAAVMAP